MEFIRRAVVQQSRHARWRKPATGGRCVVMVTCIRRSQGHKHPYPKSPLDTIHHQGPAGCHGNGGGGVAVKQLRVTLRHREV